MIITDLPSSTKPSQLRSSLISSLTLKPLLLYISILNFLWFAMAKKSWSSLSSGSGGGLRRYLNQQYYLKRPQRSALLIVAFVFLTWWLVCDRPTLAGEQQVGTHSADCSVLFLTDTFLPKKKRKICFQLAAFFFWPFFLGHLKGARRRSFQVRFQIFNSMLYFYCGRFYLEITFRRKTNGKKKMV